MSLGSSRRRRPEPRSSRGEGPVPNRFASWWECGPREAYTHPRGTPQQRGPHSLATLSGICLTTMGCAHDRDGQGIVEHVIDHPVVADADPPRCLLPDKLLRTVWPGILGEVFDGVEEPISDPSWESPGRSPSPRNRAAVAVRPVVGLKVVLLRFGEPACWIDGEWFGVGESLEPKTVPSTPSPRQPTWPAGSSDSPTPNHSPSIHQAGSPKRSKTTFSPTTGRTATAARLRGDGLRPGDSHDGGGRRSPSSGRPRTAS